MARAIKYRLQFKSLLGHGCLVNVWVEGATSSAVTTKTGADVPFDVETGVTELLGSDTPFEWQEDNSEDMLSLIRTKTGYLRVIEQTFGELDGLMPTSKTSHYVEAYYDSKKMFVGYLQPQMFTNQWSGGPQEREFPITSPLGLLDSFTFRPPTVGNTNTPDTPKMVTLGSLLKEVIDGLNAGYTNVIYPQVSGEGSGLSNWSPWDFRLYTLAVAPVDKSVPVNDFGSTTTPPVIYKPKSYEYLIDGICKCFGWMVHDDGTNLTFIDVNQDNMRKITTSQLATLSGSVTTSTRYGRAKYWSEYLTDVDDDSSLILVRPYSKITVSVPDEQNTPSMDVSNCRYHRNISEDYHSMVDDGFFIMYLLHQKTTIVSTPNPNYGSSPDYDPNGSIRNNCLFPAMWAWSQNCRSYSLQKGWIISIRSDRSWVFNYEIKMPVASLYDWLLKISFQYSLSGKIKDLQSTMPDTFPINLSISRINSNGQTESYSISQQQWQVGSPATINVVNIEESTGKVVPNQLLSSTYYGVVTDMNDVDGILIKSLTGGCLNQPITIQIALNGNFINYWKSGTLLAPKIELADPYSGYKQNISKPQHDFEYDGIGTEEASIEVTINHYGMFGNDETMAMSNYRTLAATRPPFNFDYLLNQTIKLLEQNARHRSQLYAGAMGSYYVPTFRMDALSGQWQVLSMDFNMRDDMFHLRRMLMPTSN